MPAEVGGLAAATVVVVDGASDDTAAMARKQGGLVCEVPVNRGQGAALRLGYRLARAGGARFIVTTDGDGQYDPADIERVLEPVLSGRADFVTGSRILGRQETYDRVRRAGVHVFAFLVSALTGHRVTDTSFGLRAMRAELTGGVTLEQPQYQASELLIGALMRGYRVVEVPATMRLRTAGTTKKGGNLVYGYRYARAVFGTWLRERRRAHR
jgi:glycosyltransferase involved in cell wall biosynthesis